MDPAWEKRLKEAEAAAKAAYEAEKQAQELNAKEEAAQKNRTWAPK